MSEENDGHAAGDRGATPTPERAATAANADTDTAADTTADTTVERSDPANQGGPVDRSGQAAAFDAIGARYDDAFPHKEGQLAAVDWLAESLAPGSRVLDVGCGTGMPTARRLADAGHSVVGVDLSGTMVELARKHVPEGEFRQGDLVELRPDGPGGTGQFDGVACYFTLLMLERTEIPGALRTLRSLLRPGGLLSLSMVEADLDGAPIPFLGHTIRVSGYLRDELRQVVSAAGLEVVGEDAYAYAPASPDVPPEHQLFLNCRRG